MKNVLLAVLLLGCAGGALAATGDVSKADYLQRAGSHFDQVDTNHDGVLSEQERAAAMSRLAEKRAARDGSEVTMPHREIKGDISKADFLAKAGAHFDKLDANHDGMLSRDERRAGWQAMRKS
ncbi:EF-hand domain-containing protein [Jeongeupia naejangsanensis]|uniref:EF-hand domain-containing protein n=1 Tax=Jeongeupia naejangsanensis TaxID=613195 RepID=A0ABS2BKG7_9NEIS|nr:EF-hand domain-containing protein [Jeongeupia naejangsanensis]MBM3116112.1 EF-hand domain-containing protein [Jeongeupia naejangsanensis]